MSQSERVRSEQDESFSSDFSAESNRELEAPAKILAMLRPLGKDDRYRVEALFKVKGETIDENNIIRIRLWRVWGHAPVEDGALLAEYKLDNDTLEVGRGEVRSAYEVLASHHINDLSCGVKARIVTPGTGDLDAQKPTPSNPPEDPDRHVRLFRDLLANLAPGHTILIRVKPDRGHHIIDPEQLTVVQSVTVSPASFGFGALPEEGSIWGQVRRVLPEGQLETSSEFKVLNSKASSAKNRWEAQFEKISSTRMVFSLTDFTQTS